MQIVNQTAFIVSYRNQTIKKSYIAIYLHKNRIRLRRQRKNYNVNYT